VSHSVKELWNEQHLQPAEGDDLWNSSSVFRQSSQAIVVTDDESTHMSQTDQSLQIDLALDQTGAPHPTALT